MHYLCIAMGDRTSTPLQVRMKNDMLEELKQTAEQLGTTQVGLVKLCVASFMRWAKENKVSRLPDDWAEAINEMDGRKTRYSAKLAEKPAEYGSRAKKKKREG